MSRSLANRKTLAAFATAVALFAAAGVLAVARQRASRVADEWVVHTYQVLDALDDLSSAAARAVAAEREYRLTGDPAAPAAAAAAARDARGAERLARALTVDNARQQARLDTLEPVLATTVAALDASVAARAGPLARTGALDAMVDRMERTERALLVTRRAATSAAAAAGRIATGATLLLSLLFAAGAALARRGDAAARDDAERAAREGERRARAAIDASLDEVYVLRAERDSLGGVTDFSFDDVNARAAARLGWPREAIAGRALGHLVASALGLLDECRLVMERGVLLERERPARGSAGRGRWEHVQIVPLGDGVMVTSRDVTERHGVVAALEASEERYRTMARYFPNGLVALLDRELTFVVVDGAALPALGIAREDVEGRRLAEGFSPRMVEQLSPGLEAALAGEERAVDVRFRGRTYATLAAPVRDGAGAVTGALLIAQDVTERAAMERLKGELVATVSHELRTPLTSIRGALGLMEAGVAGALPAQAASLVRIARANAERLIRLVNDVLDLEKIEARKLELVLHTLEPSEVIVPAAEGMQGAAAMAGVRVVQDIRTARAFRGDRDRLLQVLTNLLSNAVKFAPAGSEVVLRALEVPGAAGGLRLVVEGGGPGIPADQIGGLFQKFHQVDASDARARGGTGLGLAITRAIVEQHGGRVGVESEPGVRTAFWCELPAA